MFVDPAARGHGVGRKILGALEARARSLGARRLVLEMGPRQPGGARALHAGGVHAGGGVRGVRGIGAERMQGDGASAAKVAHEPTALPRCHCRLRYQRTHVTGKRWRLRRGRH
jgi:hypothetical protein